VGQTTQAWDELAGHLYGFVEAWAKQQGPPVLRKFLPEEGESTRHPALIELIKVDLQHRWTRNIGKQVEEYIVEFPELIADGAFPADLVYKEYLVRRQREEGLLPKDFYSRFPKYEPQLRRVFGSSLPKATGAADAMHPQEFPKPGERVDDFLLLDRLGRGAFATVYLAHQTSMQRTVALKVSAIRGEEAQMLAQLDHRHIVRVFDQRDLPEREQRLLYMEYVAAGSFEPIVEHVAKTPPEHRSGKMLLEIIDAALGARGEEPPSDSLLRAELAKRTWPETVCILGAQMARGLAYAHAKGVLHRDVKPANVLLAGDGRAKLADFNISHSSKIDGASPAAYLGGSMAFMSAEQLEAVSPLHEREADTLDGRTDLYALGVMLWELLTGKNPIRDEPIGTDWGAAIKAMIDRRLSGIPPERSDDIPPKSPSLLEPTLRRCLEPRPEDRFETGDQLAHQLELCLNPVAQRLMSPTPPAWVRWVRSAPMLSLILVTLVPNAVLSVINIAYNATVVVEAALWDEFQQQVAVVNIAAFSIGLAIMILWALPISRAVRAIATRSIDAEARSEGRTLSLTLGGRMAGVTMALWILGGFSFPVWRHMSAGDAAGSHYFHFVFSNLLFGVLAATAGYFFVNGVVVRALLPRLIAVGDRDAQTAAALRALPRRVLFYFGACTAVPLLSVIVLAMVDIPSKTPFFVIGIIGVVAIAVSSWLALTLQRSARGLASALD